MLTRTRILLLVQACGAAFASASWVLEQQQVNTAMTTHMRMLAAVTLLV
jgi:hypothetical protein